MKPSVRPSGEALFEMEVVGWFRDYLQRTTGRCYGDPQRLDLPGRQGGAETTPDFRLPGVDCPDAVVEMKRLMRWEGAAEKEAEALVREAVGEALCVQSTHLPSGFMLVMEAVNPQNTTALNSRKWFSDCVNAALSGCSRANFLNEVRAAFEGLAHGASRRSGGRLPFTLTRHGDVERPFWIWWMPRCGDRIHDEFVRLTDKADEQLGTSIDSVTNSERILILLATASVSHALVDYWLTLAPIRCGKQAPSITHIYSVEVCCGPPPYLLVSGLWPATNGISEKMCDLSGPDATRFNDYALGRLAQAGS